MKTLQEGRFKLIDAPRPELYDLERDPFEERNIHAERPTVADAMRRRLTQMANESEAHDGLATADELSADVRERLHALGYIGAQPLAASHPGDDRPDPKDCIGDRSGCPAGFGKQKETRQDLAVSSGHGNREQ